MGVIFIYTFPKLLEKLDEFQTVQKKFQQLLKITKVPRDNLKGCQMRSRSKVLATLPLFVDFFLWMAMEY